MLQAPELAGRVALVTGAASGIGQAVCATLALSGVRLICFDKIDSAETVRTAMEFGTEARSVHGDITNGVDVATAVDAALHTFGSLDIAVNCAGILSNTPINELSLEEWNRTLHVNLTGTFLLSQATLEPMMQQRSGRLILFASVAARMGGVRSGPAYAASKGGVQSMARWSARYAAPSGVTVNVVAPGSIRTPMTDGFGYTVDGIPLGRLGEPDDIAQAVLYLASDSAAWTTGQTLDVNGGIYMN